MARKLLSGGKTIIDTALMTGFADQSHLTRAFQKQFGVTPGYFLSARQ
ncbi:helix-turn-helix domain-containing protein [Yersinia alsatica]